ncbi:RNA polymerase subunit sigma [Candidatus Acetothermia bacterium]|jgi:RNA polymerase primary sigma factor|nr:sigma-70 family RNA polymerase sigma factor [Candidatus Bipolaricaulota bacterium]RLE37227.1 MAG: RNA polymerase subunit sigma [Candidatus Acetothermia bacterium]
MAETVEETNETQGTTDTVDILKIYFREIARFPLLSPEEEQATARAMAAGTPGARERLITSNLRLVVKIAQEYVEAGLPLIDLIQEGNVGLIEAVDRFDVEKGYRLSTYASWWIRRAILAAITDYSRMIRIPDYLFRAVRRLEQMRALARDGHFEEGEITEALGISADRLRQIESQVNEILSLDQAAGAAEGDETLEDLIADETALSPEREALRLLFRDELEEVLSHIPAREAFAIRLRYGIEDGYPYSLAEVGRIMNISRERVRQLVNQGLNRITENWGHRALDFYRGLLNE